ncbi:MAG: YHS domain-containing protein, partial [Chloroflexi bacterium]|nr:YHS domain-containing protein [Chloroflexota bacterium]
TYAYKGVTYYFCSAGCKKSFEKEPEKYLGKKVEMGHGHGGHGCC